ncbi:Phosphatidylserine decarboxylase proenzyme [Lachnellula suecica]|uniref:Phosphatidylserine decarboxylase proenzyme n=1 Tax=Lachnellula suecica TaxID=602035 RepID=A0A8T9BVA6_9HELO|nr:Phosphatidylserine decarboxylase proenzyme [Lachnellula suecica]
MPPKRAASPTKAVKPVLLPELLPVMQDLIKKINEEPGWNARFENAIVEAKAWNILQMKDIKTFSNFATWCNDLLTWVPSEDVQGKEIYNKLCMFYFVFDQPAVKDLQSPIEPRIEPNFPGTPKLTFISSWMVQYANAMGQFLDTPESISAESVESFVKSPNYNIDDYIQPRTGFKSFNDLFARNFKPGYRAIAAVTDQSVIVSPADCTFDGQWEIRSTSGVTIKNIHWHISELLDDSPYKDRFNNGIFMHAFLSPADYHRQHAPVGGTVLEARNIADQVYLEVVPQVNPDGTASLTPQRKLVCPPSKLPKLSQGNGTTFNAPDSPGYQFVQTRGLVVLDTAIGLVAVLPIGMCQVSSVVITAEVGKVLRKGEEISYFQFGGSDVVIVFEAKSNVNITAVVDTHYKMGTVIAQAYPAV